MDLSPSQLKLVCVCTDKIPYLCQQKWFHIRISPSYSLDLNRASFHLLTKAVGVSRIICLCLQFSFYLSHKSNHDHTIHILPLFLFFFCFFFFAVFVFCFFVCFFLFFWWGLFFVFVLLGAGSDSVNLSYLGDMPVIRILLHLYVPKCGERSINRARGTFSDCRSAEILINFIFKNKTIKILKI